MTSLSDTFTDIDDQIENLTAIKGEAYGKAVSMVISNYSMAFGVLKIIACAEMSDEEVKQITNDLAQIFNITGSNTIFVYCEALGLTEEQRIEAVGDGKRIVDNANRHISEGLEK